MFGLRFAGTANGETTTTAPASPPPVSITPEQEAALRSQIIAFKLLSQNLPLPALLQSAIFVPGEALRQELALAAETEEEIIVAREAAKEETERLRILARDEPSVNVVEDPTSLVYPYNSFVSPLQILRNPTGALRRPIQIPTLLPPGLDPQTIIDERNRFIAARINQRISELESLPSNLDQSNSLPGHITPSSSQKIKALIELKSLNLLARQKALRQDVVRGYNQASALTLPSDRVGFRRFKKQTLRDARVTETIERDQKVNRDQRAKQKHLDHLTDLANHARNLEVAHRAHTAKFQRLGKSLLKFHVDAEKEEQRRVERVSKERLRALRADDEEGYLALIDTAKDTRITHLLRQTDAFLDSLATAVVAQQNDAQNLTTPRAAAIPAPEAMLVDESVDEGRFGAVPVFAEEAKDKVDYYNVAHRIKEKITEQPKMLIGGELKSYQLKGLEWMISLYNNHVNGILADEMVRPAFLLSLGYA